MVFVAAKVLPKMVLLADKELPSLGAGLSKVVVLPGSTAGELKVDMIEELIRRIEGQVQSMVAKLSACVCGSIDACEAASSGNAGGHGGGQAEGMEAA